MPSLHIAWSTWCTLAVCPRLPALVDADARHRSTRWLTLLCIVVTANHYFLDAVGGLVILGGRLLAAHAAVAPELVHAAPVRRRAMP